MVVGLDSSLLTSSVKDKNPSHEDAIDLGAGMGLIDCSSAGVWDISAGSHSGALLMEDLKWTESRKAAEVGKMLGIQFDSHELESLRYLWKLEAVEAQSSLRDRGYSSEDNLLGRMPRIR